MIATTVESPFYDAVIIGAGFGGIYQLHSLLKLGLSVRVLEKAHGLGGTWYWNRYPGAMSDTPSYVYRYSWDKEDLQQYAWKDNYLDAKDILAYLEHIVERHRLREHLQFNTEVLSARWHEGDGIWLIETDNGGAFRARYLITAIGLLSAENWPSIPGRETYKGELYHTARWPESYDFSNKKVGVIGNGSTGVQVITDIAKNVGSLLCFQRHPQYTVPAGRRAVAKEERDAINSTYDEIWHKVRHSIGGMGFEEAKVAAMSVSEQERERVYQAAWDKGGGLNFLLGTFNDITFDETANRTACDFIKGKIAQIVHDPEKRRKLMPTELYARRPLCDTGYYEQFNRENVDIVDIRTNPIAEFTSGGIRQSDGTAYDLDVIICATGFNAFDGAYRRIRFEGRNGLTLDEYWKQQGGAVTNMGVAVAQFPNLFMILGPQSPLANVPPMLEAHVEFITDAIKRAEEHSNKQQQDAVAESSPHQKSRAVKMIETTQEGVDEWGKLCNFVSDKMLFKTSASYFYGANVEGKTRSVLVFLGGLGMFIQRLNECKDGGYSGFHPF
ncbi:uncharacterized protein Z519_01547 [Cladophialophora bantiana CBS 173.52]|uniref:Cyclohexanone monooxygenase n=1 Tax=Cladophialophora bantiana (strain ATCC 10958 / CBS 173.52 / CDC B-1940 / NIH 8579) TaxID=1442370 RepID=A0A0D2HX52_CLAB1|nr:uncharacterized protein Z519_01547 [Cladophialophora bantiana CBS 173.52]KIW97963.1 hypothetical protein Z519_01547 [Cladophialophora bantiana CBS 173.52]